MVSHATRRRRWPARIAGLLATAGLLGTGVWIAIMVVPGGGGEEAVVAAPAVSDAEVAAEAEPPAEPRFTRAQRRARQAAVDEVTVTGLQVVRLSDYDPEAELRVLLGEAEDGTRRAFFFRGRRFVGYDSEFASGRLRVVRAGKRAVTLRYGLADGGADRVRFAWEGETLVPETAPPDPALRAAP